MWVNLVENEGGYITDKILSAKALSINESLNIATCSANSFINNFKASNEWLQGFKKKKDTQ